MTSKISALSAVVTPAETDQHEVNQGGTSKRITNAQILSLRGLMAFYKTSGNTTYASASNDRINFNTSVYDPLSTVTIGSSWAFAAPATGYYEVTVGGLLFDGNGAAGWSAGDVVEPYLSGSGGFVNAFGTIRIAAAIAGTSDWLTISGTLAVSLAAAATCFVKLDNSASTTRRLYAAAQVMIKRVA